MRSFDRFSVDGATTGVLRNRLAAILEAVGFALNPNVTATWEHSNISEVDSAMAMASFWQQAAVPDGVAHIDHVWTYCDNPPPVH